MKTISIISTSDAARITKRLTNHWKHKFEVSETAELSQIFMPQATITLAAGAETLAVKIESDLEDLTQLKEVVVNHLNRMANTVLDAQWQDA
jgi:uncharacterized protein